MSQHLREVARGGATGIVRTTVPVKKPAAATGLTLTPPAGRAWDVRSLNFTYVGSTSAGTRIPTLALTDSNALLWEIDVGSSWQMNIVQLPTAYSVSD